MTAAMPLERETHGPGLVPGFVPELALSLLAVAGGGGEPELAHAEALAAVARRHLATPDVHDYEGKPRSMLAELHANARELRDVARHAIMTFDAVTRSEHAPPLRLAKVFADMREIFELIGERAWETIDALEYEIDSIDAAAMMREPSNAVPWAEAMRSLDLPDLA